MSMITGVVSAITPNNGVSKRTGKTYTIWTVTVNGQDIKAGFKKPGFNVGDSVTLTTSVNKWGDTEIVEPGTAMSGGAARPAPISPPGGSGGGGFSPGGRTFPVAINSPEMSIIRQNALTNANAAVVNHMTNVAHDASLTIDEYAELVIDVAYRFAEFSSGQREAKSVEAKASSR